jgi:hypothetical protein
MAKNAATKKVTARSILSGADFRDGMADYFAGRPIRDQWESTDRKHVGARQWSYERGRQFACYLRSIGAEGFKIKDRARVTWEAIEVWNDARRAGFIL